MFSHMTCRFFRARNCQCLEYHKMGVNIHKVLERAGDPSHTSDFEKSEHTLKNMEIFRKKPKGQRGKRWYLLGFCTELGRIRSYFFRCRLSHRLRFQFLKSLSSTSTSKNPYPTVLELFNELATGASYPRMSDFRLTLARLMIP
jgi:hypothetical protein